MDFPRLVYKCPGEFAHKEGSHAHRLVLDAEQLGEAKAAGWCETLPEAIEAQEKPANGIAKPAPVAVTSAKPAKPAPGKNVGNWGT